MATKLLTVLALTTGVISAPAASQSLKNLVVFGDSYSDEARFAYIRQNKSLPPGGQMLPEADSPFSDGRIWGRVVAKNTGATLYDYAVGGAMCTRTNFDQRKFDGTDIPYPDVLEYQLPQFNSDKQAGLYKNLNPQNTVYTLWIGTNDLGQDGLLGREASDPEKKNNVDPNASVNDYLTCVWNAIEQIYHAGGRNFVLFKLVPLEKAPLYAKWELRNRLSKDVTDVNAKYDQDVEEKARKLPGATITIFDAHKLVSNVIERPSDFQFTQVAAPYKTCKGNDCQKASDPQSNYLWNDALHLSPAAEQLIAKEFQRAIEAGGSEYAKKYGSSA